jgi:hypothetical protein
MSFLVSLDSARIQDVAHLMLDEKTTHYLW